MCWIDNDEKEAGSSLEKAFLKIKADLVFLFIFSYSIYLNLRAAAVWYHSATMGQNRFTATVPGHILTLQGPPSTQAPTDYTPQVFGKLDVE